MNTVHIVLPDGVDDPDRVSGGNVYDRRICRGLASQGWSVHEHSVPGSWPWPDATALASLAEVTAKMPSGAVVLLDGLIASTAEGVLEREADRLRLVILVHMPLDTGQERAVLSAAAAVVVTSPWTRRRLLDRYALWPNQVHVAPPGVDSANIVAGTKHGGQLICVAAVTPAKGHDVLLAALAMVGDLPWRCAVVGALDRDPGFVDRLRDQAREYGVDERVCFAGPRTGHELDDAYADADVLLLASRAETYGMVVTEALARGLPVIATGVGGLPDALGRVADGSRPGLLVRPDSPVALAEAVSSWLTDADLRQRLRHAARERRTALPDWSTTAVQLSTVLVGVPA